MSMLEYPKPQRTGTAIEQATRPILQRRHKHTTYTSVCRVQVVDSMAHIRYDTTRGAHEALEMDVTCTELTS